jgi:tripartite-type tricarboxylate transporter receptor subunit TctC
MTKFNHDKTTKHLKNKIFSALTFSIAILSSSFSYAQNTGDWPNKPINLIVPIAPGGGTDIIARAVANELGPMLGTTIVVQNRAGANGTIGTSAVARAAPDGYTIMVGSIGTHAANACLYDLPYDPLKDFEAIGLLANYNNVFIVNADSPIKSIEDLVSKAKASPGKLTHAVTVIGSSSHLAIERFKQIANVQMLSVPYNGAPAATTDLMGGRVDFMLDTIVSQYGNISAGKMRALGSTMAMARSPVLPEVKTVAEQGYPTFDTVGWTGLFAPAGTPPAVVEKIATALQKVYAGGKLQASLGSKGLDVTTTTPPKFKEYVAQELSTWCDVIKRSNIKVN